MSAAALAMTIDLRMKSSRYPTVQPAILAPTVVAAGYRVNFGGGSMAAHPVPLWRPTGRQWAAS